MSGEFEEIDDLDEPAQGDVIEWVGEDRQSPWQLYGVIVTADCDIAWKKNRGVLSYVPAMMTRDFIWEHWRKDRIGPHLTDILQKAAIRISRWRKKKDDTASDISNDALRAWLDRSDPSQLLDELGVTDNGERANLLSVIEPAFLIMRALECKEPDFDLLNRAFECINAKAKTDRNIIISDIQKSWGSLPGDVFHLPSMPTPVTIDKHDDTADGLFLMLRNIRQIDSSAVTARPDVIRSGDARAKRIARVTAPYRYAITQNLARVFSDIGLPEDHEARCKQAAQRFFGDNRAA